MPNYVDVHIRGRNEVPGGTPDTSEMDKQLRLLRNARQEWQNFQEQTIKTHETHRKNVKVAQEQMGFFKSAVEEFGKKLIAAFSVYQIEEFVRKSVLAFASAERAGRDAQQIGRLNNQQLQQIRDDASMLERETGAKLEDLLYEYAQFVSRSGLEAERARGIFTPLVEAASTWGVETQDLLQAATSVMTAAKLNAAETRKQINEWQDILPGMGDAFVKQLPQLTTVLKSRNLFTKQSSDQLAAIYRSLVPAFGEQGAAETLQKILTTAVSDPRFISQLDQMAKDSKGGLDVFKMFIDYIDQQHYGPGFLAQLYPADVVVGLQQIKEHWGDIGTWMKQAAADTVSEHQKIQERNKDFTGAVNDASGALRDFGRALGGVIAPWVKTMIENEIQELINMHDLVTGQWKPTWGEIGRSMIYGPNMGLSLPRGWTLPGMEENLSKRFYPGQVPPISPYQTGGLVTQPTVAMLGETGPEAVVPMADLKRAQAEQEQKDKEEAATVGRLHELAMAQKPRPRFKDWDDIVSGALLRQAQKAGIVGGGGRAGGAGATGTTDGDGTTSDGTTSTADTGGTQPAPPGAAGTYRPVYKLSDADLSDAVVNTVAGEAYANNQESVDAVINNMLNRVGSKGWGPSGNLQQVARAPGQYTGYRRANAKEAAFIRDRIKAIASGGVADNTSGSNEYRAGSYRGPWYVHHQNAPVIGGNRFGYNPKVSNGPYAPYPVKKMAEGGVVDKPTLALVGEAGPEVVVPVDADWLSGAQPAKPAKPMGKSQQRQFWGQEGSTPSSVLGGRGGGEADVTHTVRDIGDRNADILMQPGRHRASRWHEWLKQNPYGRGISEGETTGTNPFGVREKYFLEQTQRQMETQAVNPDLDKRILEYLAPRPSQASLTDGGSSGGGGASASYPDFGGGFGGGRSAPSDAVTVVAPSGGTEDVAPLRGNQPYMPSHMAAPLRYNNPGSQAINQAARDYFGAVSNTQIGPVKSDYITGFPSNELGAASNMFLLAHSPLYHNKTIGQGQDSWARGIRKGLPGYDPSEVLTDEKLHNRDFMVKFMKSIGQAELGKPYPMTDEEWNRAYDRYITASAKEAEKQAKTTAATAQPPAAPAVAEVQPKVTSQAVAGAKPPTPTAPKMSTQTRRNTRRQVAHQYHTVQAHAEAQHQRTVHHGSAGHIS